MPKVARPYHHGDLRRALLAAALQIVRTEGSAALTLRAVARRARVSHQAPYHHFADHAALVAAVAQEGFERLLAELSRARRSATNPVESLQAGGVAYVVFAVRRPEQFRVMFGPELSDRTAHPDLDQAARRVFDSLLAPARDVRQTPMPGVDTVGAALWSVVHGLATLLVDGQLSVSPTGRGRKATSATAARRLTLEVTERIWFGLQAGLTAPDGY